MSATTTLTLSPRIDALIKEKVASGQYADANEVIGEGLRLLDKRDRLEQQRAEIAIGFEEIERGEYTPDFMQRLMREAEKDERDGVPIDDAVLP